MQTTSTCSHKSWQAGPDQSETKPCLIMYVARRYNFTHIEGPRDTTLWNWAMFHNYNQWLQNNRQIRVFPPIQEMVVLLKPRNSMKIITPFHLLLSFWQESLDQPGGNSSSCKDVCRNTSTIYRHLNHVRAIFCERNLHNSSINFSSYPEAFQFPRGRLPSPPYTLRNF